MWWHWETAWNQIRPSPGRHKSAQVAFAECRLSTCSMSCPTSPIGCLKKLEVPPDDEELPAPEPPPLELEPLAPPDCEPPPRDDDPPLPDAPPPLLPPDPVPPPVPCPPPDPFVPDPEAPPLEEFPPDELPPDEELLLPPDPLEVVFASGTMAEVSGGWYHTAPRKSPAMRSNSALASCACITSARPAPVAFRFTWMAKPIAASTSTERVRARTTSNSVKPRGGRSAEGVGSRCRQSTTCARTASATPTPDPFSVRKGSRHPMMRRLPIARPRCAAV